MLVVKTHIWVFSRLTWSNCSKKSSTLRCSISPRPGIGFFQFQPSQWAFKLCLSQSFLEEAHNCTKKTAAFLTWEEKNQKCANKRFFCFPFYLLQWRKTNSFLSQQKVSKSQRLETTPFPFNEKFFCHPVPTRVSPHLPLPNAGTRQKQPNGRPREPHRDPWGLQWQQGFQPGWRRFVPHGWECLDDVNSFEGIIFFKSFVFEKKGTQVTKKMLFFLEEVFPPVFRSNGFCPVNPTFHHPSWIRGCNQGFIHVRWLAHLDLRLFDAWEKFQTYSPLNGIFF